MERRTFFFCQKCLRMKRTV
ncbi:hypothetical protein ELP67_07455 [Bacillus safensis]|nr:hypothetical protein ELP67_07455 [Bacillus safensis]